MQPDMGTYSIDGHGNNVWEGRSTEKTEQYQGNGVRTVVRLGSEGS